MKITAMMAMAAVAGLGAQAARASESERTLTVYINNEHIAMPATMFAKDQAAKMFARIGLKVVWRSFGRSPLPADAIVVDMVEQGAKTRCQGALACAAPYEGIHIQVFYDRVQATVSPNMVPTLLAHVLVHEITHILQGAGRHSESGVMKAQWGNQDFAEMSHRSLAFTETDVLLIQNGLTARQARLASVTAVDTATAAN